MNRGAGLGFRAVRALAIAVGAAYLAGCGGGGGSTVSLNNVVSSTGVAGGGGGSSVTQSPYLLFSNDYIAYPSPPVNGAYLHSIQGGDVYGVFGGQYVFGGYSSPQADMNRSGFYALQTKGGATAPTSASDYALVAILAPQDSTFDISQANTLLITMGNTQSNPTGHADVFTVDINDGIGSATPANDCSYDQTLSELGPNTSTSALGVRNYAIPLSQFSCSSGSMTGLKSTGITTVAVKIIGSKNPNVTAGEYDVIAVGSVGFSNWSASSSDIAALAQ
jgi:hypothetical protein